MDDKDKNFEKDLVNNLDQQRAEMAAGAEIEEIQEQRMAERQEETVATGVEREAEAAAGARMEEQVAKIGPMNGTQAENGVETAGRRPMSEAEAKALLMEETQKTERKLAKAHKNNQKIAIIAVIIAVVLCVAGVVLALVIGNRTEEDKGGDKGQIETPVADEDEKKPDGEPEESKDEIVAMSVDDPLVQRLYGNFFAIGEIFDGWWGFYTDGGVKDGKISLEKMLALAGANFRNNACVGDYEYGNGGKIENDCSAGEDVRQKVAEMFGVDIQLSDGDKMGDFCGGKIYVAENDEFYQVGNGCGGASSMRLVRVLEKAEGRGNEIDLFEKVLIFDTQEYYQVGIGDVKGERVGEYSIPDDVLGDSEKYNEWLTQNEINLTDRYGSEFKWIFMKNESGDYIFTGLERVE